MIRGRVKPKAIKIHSFLLDVQQNDSAKPPPHVEDAKRQYDLDGPFAVTWPRQLGE